MLNATRLMLVCAWTLVFAPCQWAQHEEQAAPTQDQTPVAPAEEPQATSSLAPDTRPLSGMEELQVESPSRSRNFVLPSIRLTAYGDTNRTILSGGGRGTELSGGIIGGLAVHQVSRKNDFSFDYQGGGMLYSRNSDLNAMVHQLGFTETYQGRRAGIMIGNRLSYLPESAFGFGGFGSTPGLGGGYGGALGNWNPAFNANQTLYTGRGSRIANSSMVQFQYNASARSSLTLGANYGLFRFRNASLFESDFSQATVGYNYMVNRRDSVAVTYGLSLFNYKSIEYDMTAHFAQLAYSRRITGRVVFQLSAGPQFIFSRSGISGRENRAYWSAHTAIQYQQARTSFDLSYAHYTSSGSGLLLGSSTDQIRFGVRWRLTRNWSYSIAPGYTRNHRLRQGPTPTGASSYNSVYASTSLNRDLGRYMDLSFNYVMHEQWSNAVSPTGIDTGSTYLRHHFGVTLGWHGRRIGMD